MLDNADPLLLYGIAAVTALVMPMVLLIAVACSPVAAFLTANQARERGRNPILYACLGATYCALLLLPWIGLMFLMVVLGSVVIISAVSLVIYHQFVNWYTSSSERALHYTWNVLGEILYITPFALVIVNVSIFWLVLADSIGSLYG